MTRISEHPITDRAERIIAAPPDALYRAFLDPRALALWLPPQGMRARILEFDPRPGGRYRMALTYADSGHPTAGKTAADTDVVAGRFLDFVENRRVVQQAEFLSDHPDLQGAMTITWRFDPVPGGTLVTVLCEQVPKGVRAEDHDTGLRSTLDNLAAFAAGEVA